VDAFEPLYHAHALDIHDFLLRTLRESGAALALTQNTFVQAFARWEQRSDEAELFDIAWRLASDRLSQGRLSEDIDSRDDLAAPASGPDEQEAAALVWTAACSLDAHQYAVLDLGVRRHLTADQIARAIGAGAAEAEMLADRARAALEVAVEQAVVDPCRARCDRLAELTPCELAQLTAAERASVKRHMRRCDTCRVMVGVEVTDPVGVLADLMTVEMPTLLDGSHRQALRTTLLSGPPPLPLPALTHPAQPPSYASSPVGTRGQRVPPPSPSLQPRMVRDSRPPIAPPPYYYAPSPPTNGLAIASMVLGILWLSGLGALLALILGNVALSQIKRRGEGGRGMAITGVVLGWVGLVLLLVIVILVVVAQNAAGPASFGY
jgi:DNA-directed RNA polymerase specialized sigma24 family protein